MYVKQGRKTLLGPHAIVNENGYGLIEFDAEAGVEYKLMIINWGERPSAPKFTLKTYTLGSKVYLYE
jgi:hypothetical protein